MTVSDKESNIDFLMRPAISVYIITYIFIGFLLGIFLLVAIKNNDVWEPFVALSVIAVLVYYIIRSNRVEVVNGRCLISKPFSKDVSFNVNDIRYMRIVPAFQGYSAKMKAPFTIEICLFSNEDITNIGFNAKLFGLEDIEKLTNYCKTQFKFES